MYNTFPNYQSPLQYGYQPVTTAPQLQPEQVTQVNGKASVDQIRLAPNSSKIVMDTTAPMVWLCVSDGVGRVTATPYDIIEHKDAPPIDLGSIEQRIANIEEYIRHDMEVKSNGKPDAPAPITEQRNVSGGKRDR